MHSCLKGKRKKALGIKSHHEICSRMSVQHIHAEFLLLGRTASGYDGLSVGTSRSTKTARIQPSPSKALGQRAFAESVLTP